MLTLLEELARRAPTLAGGGSGGWIRAARSTSTLDGAPASRALMPTPKVSAVPVRRRKRPANGSEPLESHAGTSRVAAKWLGIITVDVLAMAGSVSSTLVARAHRHWSVVSTLAHSRRRLLLQRSNVLERARVVLS